MISESTETPRFRKIAEICPDSEEGDERLKNRHGSLCRRNEPGALTLSGRVKSLMAINWNTFGGLVHRFMPGQETLFTLVVVCAILPEQEH